MYIYDQIKCLTLNLPGHCSPDELQFLLAGFCSPDELQFLLAAEKYRYRSNIYWTLFRNFKNLRLLSFMLTSSNWYLGFKVISINWYCVILKLHWSAALAHHIHTHNKPTSQSHTHLNFDLISNLLKFKSFFQLIISQARSQM